MARTEYTPAMVTKALMQLVANGGNVNKTSEDLIDDEFQVPVATLRAWKNDVHAEQYRRLEITYGHELEQEAVEAARRNIQIAGEKKRGLLDRIEPAKVPYDQLASTLKAVTDAEAKGVQGLLQLTGRPTNPQGHGAVDDVVRLLETMRDRGYVSMAPGVSLEIEPPKKVVNEAEQNE